MEIVMFRAFFVSACVVFALGISKEVSAKDPAIHIVSSRYGTANKANPIPVTTKIARDECENKPACYLVAENGLQGGDPDFGTIKTLDVSYYCGRRTRHGLMKVSAPEHQVANLGCVRQR